MAIQMEPQPHDCGDEMVRLREQTMDSPAECGCAVCDGGAEPGWRDRLDDEPEYDHEAAIEAALERDR